MTTRKLWRVLNDPPTLHPLFWKTIYGSGATQFPMPNHQMNSLVESGISVYVLVLLFVWAIARWNGSIWGKAFINLLLLSLSLPVFIVGLIMIRYTFLNATVNGIFWAIRISYHIAHEYRRGLLEILWLSPPGALGAAMAITTGCLYRKDTLNQFRTQQRLVMLIVLMVGVTTSIIMDLTTPSPTHILTYFALVITLVTGLYIDAIHTTLLSILVGMLVPTYTHNSFDSRLGTGLVFLLLQGLTFLITLLTGLVIIPGLFQMLHITGWYTDFVVLAAGLLVFYLFREMLIHILWRKLSLRFNADPQQMRFWP